MGSPRREGKNPSRGDHHYCLVSATWLQNAFDFSQDWLPFFLSLMKSDEAPFVFSKSPSTTSSQHSDTFFPWLYASRSNKASDHVTVIENFRCLSLKEC